MLFNDLTISQFTGWGKRRNLNFFYLSLLIIKKSAIEIFEEALSVSQKGYKIVHERDIDEICVNNYNTE